MKDFHITRVCPYDKTDVDVSDCWNCKFMLPTGCILDSQKLTEHYEKDSL